jgi:hypothetical protein
MSLLKFYTSSITESQKVGYKNDFSHTILHVNGDYIPAWSLVATGSTILAYLEELSTDALRNGIILLVDSETLSSYSAKIDQLGSYLTIDKEVQTLTGIHRLRVNVDGTNYYSDIFMNINKDLPNYRITDINNGYRII